MASPKKTLVLDLGMQSLRLAEFAVSPSGGLKLLRGARREFLLDPALDPSRPDQAGLALADILKTWKLRGGSVSCVLPAHTVFTRVVPLDVPGGLSGKIDAVAHFEAQQNIPFPLDEVIWDYAVMGETPTGAVNVLFLAVKTDLLESICEAIAGAGLDISYITTAPVALYDAYRLSSPGDEPVLILDCGSRTTNMVAAAPGSFFCRSIPAGGLAITTAISKDIHAPLEEAEQLKVTRGSVGLGAGFEPPADPIEANLAKISRQALIKTQADISRSISYYRSNLGGPDISRLLLSGGVAAMPYFAEFLQEKFQKEIGFLNTSEGISTTADGASFAEANPHNLAELIGGALAVVPQQHTSVHLLPPSISKRQEFSKRFPYLAAAAALFLLTICTWWFYAVSATQATDAESGKITSEIQSKKEISAKLADLLEKEKAIAKKSAELRDLVLLREAYPRILAELAAKVPERFLWITEIQPASGESSPTPSGAPSPTGQKTVEGTVTAIIVKGLYLDNPRQATVVDDFVTALQSSDVFVVEEKDKSKIITQRGSPSGEYWAYPFALRIPLRTPITQLP